MCGGGGGGSAKTPDPIPSPTPISTPTVDTARQNRQTQDTTLARKGRASTILTGNEGVMAAPETGTKKLLGS